MSSRQKGHRWQPIEDLAAELRTRRFPELDGLLAVLEKRRGELEGANAVREFLARLVRSWSIETGILERLYTLSDSATVTLVEQGFDAALLSHGDTDLAPQQLVDILRDHQDAAEGLFAFVRGGRALSTSYVKELHQVLTRHQPTCDALDQQGNWVKVPLRRGDWKLLPNNLGDVKTGEVWHQYCPPEQVASEMESLIAMHGLHGDVHFVVEAAWLHHRFTQIHPFQDGNGRVARALASLVCTRAGGLPVVVLRTQKEPYFRALEQADGGDLKPLIDMIERQQHESVLKALSTSDAVISEASTVDEILDQAKQRLDAAKEKAGGALSRIIGELVQVTAARFEAVAVRVAKSLQPTVSAQVQAPSTLWGTLSAPIVKTLAAQLGYEPNFRGVRSTVALQLRQATGGVAMLVLSFHQAGRIDDAVGVAVAILTGANDPLAPTPPRGACEAPLTFTADRDPVELRETFAAWLERDITRGLDLWQRDL